MVAKVIVVRQNGTRRKKKIWEKGMEAAPASRSVWLAFLGGWAPVHFRCVTGAGMCLQFGTVHGELT